MSPYIFVYGSLVSAARHPQGDRLRREALLLGPATIAGRLYRVSWYPGLRPPERPGDAVHGEVYRMADPNVSLDWLDRYEGITRGGASAAAPDEYERVERQVRLAAGDTLVAWVYFYRLALPHAAWMPAGRWQG